MTLQRIKLTLPNGDLYEGVQDISLNPEVTREWLLSGGSTVIGVTSDLFNEVGGTDIIKTPLASGHLGPSAGSRVLELSWTQPRQFAHTFGPKVSSGDPIFKQISVFEHELSTAEDSSLNPATLEYGEHSSSASTIYDPIPVIIQQATPTHDTETESSTFTARVTLNETIDLSQAIDGSASVTADYELDSANASVTIPFSADTLQAARQEQGFEVSVSGLSEKNAASATSASPTSSHSKLLPKSFTLSGAFRGSNAASLASDLETEFLANDAVEQVTLSAPGLSSPNPLAGTYTLGDNSAIDPIIPQVEGGLYGFELDLTQT